MTTTQSIPEIAAAIRRIVTPRSVRDQIASDAADPETTLVLPLLLHFRPDRCPEAAIAHVALVKQVRSDLAECGIANTAHLKLVELLYAYLDGSGYRFTVEQWVGDSLMIDTFGRWEKRVALYGGSP
jgi:hypothetical protein